MMGGSEGLSLPVFFVFTFLIVTQILAISLLPRTAGFTNVTWTLTFLRV